MKQQKHNRIQNKTVHIMLNIIGCHSDVRTHPLSVSPKTAQMLWIM